MSQKVSVYIYKKQAVAEKPFAHRKFRVTI